MGQQPTLAILTLCSLVVLVTLPLAAVQQEGEVTVPAVEKHPKAVIKEPVKDFGKVDKGSELSHDYVISNEGDADLEILRVVPFCGCTVVDFDRVIPPGKSGKVRAIIDTTPLTGATTRDIGVFTNDPAQPRIRLAFVVDAEPHLAAYPGYARYQVVHGEDKPGIIPQTVWALDDVDFKILEVESPYPFLITKFHKATEKERLDKIEEPGPQWIVELNLKYGDAPVGPLAGEVVVHTNHKIQKRILIPVTGFVRPAMWANPDRVSLGEVTLTKPETFSIVIQNFLTEPMKITGVESTVEGLEISYNPLEGQEGRKYRVQVKLLPEMPKGEFEGVLRIKTSNPKNPVVEVPMRGKVL